MDYALSCKKGGFISLRHNQIRNLTALQIFFDIRVFNPMAQRYGSQQLTKAYEIN